MGRSRVNKRRSHGAFKQRSGKTHRKNNMTVFRGGTRL